jgi:predicted TIM-barrel fold metal-dependent hydrolase
LVTIDIHLHLGLVNRHIPKWWAEEVIRPFGTAFHSSSGKEIIELLDKAGIDIGIVQAGDFRRTTYHPDYPTEHEVFVPNDYVAEEVKKYPGRLYGRAVVDPLRDPQAAVLELERCVKDLDMRVLKLSPTYQHFYPSDERLDPIYEKCIELDIPCMFHMGWAPIINAPMKYQDPVLLDDVGIKFRKLKVIVAHLGYPWVDQGICLVAKHPNFYCDMAFWCGFGPEYLYQTLLKLKSLNAIDRVLYGSENNCTATFPSVYNRVNTVAEKLNLPRITEEEMANIMGETAAKLLKIKN